MPHLTDSMHWNPLFSLRYWATLVTFPPPGYYLATIVGNTEQFKTALTLTTPGFH